MKLKHSLILLLFLAMMACNSGEKSTATKPNIVFVFTDDQRYNTIAALGNDIIKTPNLDRLANQGTTFTHAYNMGGWNGAICVASRAMIISGASVWRAKQREDRWLQNDSTAIRETWPMMMAEQGYTTYMTGKWHVQTPADGVFDHVKHVRGGMPPDAWGKGGGRAVAEAIRDGGDVDAAMPVGYNRPLSENDTSWSPSDPKFGGFWEGGKHWSEVVRDDALAFIEDATSKEEPFFMYLAFNAPHDPRQSPQEYVDMYPVEDIPLPENFLPEHPWKDSIGNSRDLRDEALAPYPRTEYAVKKHIQEYYAIISHLDTQIGAILDALEASGEMDNTYIFFTSDHGLAVGQHGLIGKQSLYDHSIRVPLMVVGPNVPRDKKFDYDVYLQDIMATSLELAGVEKPDHVEFNSFLDILSGKRRSSHYDAIYGAYMDYQRMIRKDGYKLLVYPRIDKVLLFNLEEDPLEMNDLAGDPAHQDRVKELFADLVELQKEMGDGLELDVRR